MCPRALHLIGRPLPTLTLTPHPTVTVRASHLALVEVLAKHLQHKFLKAQDGDADVIIFQFHPDSSSTQELEQPSKCSNLGGDQ